MGWELVIQVPCSSFACFVSVTPVTSFLRRTAVADHCNHHPGHNLTPYDYYYTTTANNNNKRKELKRYGFIKLLKYDTNWFLVSMYYWTLLRINIMSWSQNFKLLANCIMLVSWPWRWRRNFPPKRMVIFNVLHCVIPQKIKLIISTDVSGQLRLLEFYCQCNIYFSLIL